MFATLLGALPQPPLPDDASTEALVEAAVRAQEAAGLDPVTDGGLRPAGDAVRAWQATARLTDRSVKHVLIGPYSRARTAGDPPAALVLAGRLNSVLRDLAAAGCPLIEIHEPAAVDIGEDADERARFRDAHLRMLDGVTGTHLSLAITGGNANAAGIETLLAAPYASLAVDLVAGPDNWYLVVATPGDRGIVCGALPADADSVDGPETLLWAAGYAASTKGRGPARVGLATASSLAHLPWALAIEKMGRLGDALRIAGLPAEERLRAVDPRAVSSRSAAIGRVEPSPSRPPRRGPDPT
jgi:methionine synthase II (cobalamin-independent)